MRQLYTVELQDIHLCVLRVEGTGKVTHGLCCRNADHCIPISLHPEQLFLWIKTDSSTQICDSSGQHELQPSKMQKSFECVFAGFSEWRS